MQIRHLTTAVHGRYLVHPVDPTLGKHWVIGFHGYGETAESHLNDLLRIPAGNLHYAAIQALHPFYTRSGKVVASWMTSLDREHAIADNLRYVDAVIAELRQAHKPARISLLGYSQGAATALRSGFLGTERVDEVIAVGGELPPELCTRTSLPPLPVLFWRGINDPHYSAEQQQRDISTLAAQNVPALGFEYHGGHEWNEELLERLARELTKPAARG